MPSLISSVSQAKGNIANYRSFIQAHSDLQERLSMHRAWYAVRKDGGWLFGNSKVVGFIDLTPEIYLAGGLDGRQTEAVLGRWFEEVAEGDPLYDELWEALSSFLARYGKRPSQLARINVPRSEVSDTDTDHADAICDLIFEVAKGLDPERIKALRKKLNSLL